MNNTKTQKFFFYLMLLVIAASIAAPGIRLVLTPMPEAVGGIIDLTDWNYTRDGAVRLNGEWEFYDGQLLSPGDFSAKQPERRTLQQVPARWSSYSIDGVPVSTYGTATYRLKILLPPLAGNYGIKTTSIYASARIFADGRQILTCGSPGDTAETTEHEYYADAGYFTTDKNEVELVVQAANYISAYNGIFYSIYFGDQQAISQIRLYHFFIDAALISGMFFMSLYFLGLGSQRKNNPDVVFLALYCFFSALYTATCSEAILNYAFTGLSYNASVKIQTLAIILSLAFFFRFAYSAFKVSYHRNANRIINGIIISFIVLTCFTKFYLWQYTFILFALGNIFVFTLVFHIMYKHLHANIEGRYYLYTALISSMAYFIVTVCNIVLAVESNLFLPVFQPIFVLSAALYMSEKYESSYRTIEKLSSRLVVLDKLKDDFLAKTSHELKTPLNGIINISRSLLDGADGGLNTAQAEDIRLITSIGQRLSTLVNDILDYSKLKVMDIKLNIICLDVHQVAESTVEIFRYLTKGRSLVLENKIPPKRYIILADEHRLRQIISNLLDNSVKFTTSGHISIDCRRERDLVWIEVRDTGSGIPENKLEGIFTAYEQLEGQTSDARGAGLGLSIVKQLVELHQGQIFVQSEPGQGACFTFSMPLAKDGSSAGALSGNGAELEYRSSRPGEFHPQPLTEPNVKVSLHSALVIQSQAVALFASGKRSLACLMIFF